jgi:hypothetical protein
MIDFLCTSQHTQHNTTPFYIDFSYCERLGQKAASPLQQLRRSFGVGWRSAAAKIMTSKIGTV